MESEESRTSSPDVSKLCGLLEKKISLFKDFISATVSLKDMIKEHNAEGVENIIAERQDHIVLINRLDDQIRMIRDANPFREALHDPKAQKRIQPLIKMVENVVSRTIRLNQECEAAAEDELDKLKTGLSGIGNRGKLFKGYRGKSWEPRFLDVKT